MAREKTHYQLFSSENRGAEDVEKKLNEFIESRQTPDNLEKMARGLAMAARKKGKDGLTVPRLRFSDFEEKLNKAKEEVFGDEKSRKPAQ